MVFLCSPDSKLVEKTAEAIVRTCAMRNLEGGVVGTQATNEIPKILWLAVMSLVPEEARNRQISPVELDQNDGAIVKRLVRDVLQEADKRLEGKLHYDSERIAQQVGKFLIDR